MAEQLLADYMTPLELAAELRVHPRTLRKWDEQGGGPPKTQLGRMTLYRRQSVLEWIAGREQRRNKRHA